MTFSRFFAFGFLTAFVNAVLEIIFFNILNDQSPLLHYVFWVLVAVFAIAFSRRVGVLNYLESMVLIVFWFISALFIDLAFTGRFLGGLDIFKNPYIWIGHLVVALAIFIFHKKRHVQIRRQQKQK